MLLHIRCSGEQRGHGRELVGVRVYVVGLGPATPGREGITEVGSNDRRHIAEVRLEQGCVEVAPEVVAAMLDLFDAVVEKAPTRS